MGDRKEEIGASIAGAGMMFEYWKAFHVDSNYVGLFFSERKFFNHNFIMFASCTVVVYHATRIARPVMGLIVQSCLKERCQEIWWRSAKFSNLGTRIKFIWLFPRDSMEQANQGEAKCRFV
jgi:hypothetical protein